MDHLDQEEQKTFATAKPSGIMWLRYTLSVILMAIGVALGFLRMSYIINLNVADLPLLILRRHYRHQVIYTTQSNQILDAIQHDPRWLSSFIYSVSPMIIALLVVWLIFKDPKKLRITFWTYLGANGVLLFFLLISFLTHNYTLGYGMAQNFKALVQSSFLTLLLIATFKYFDKLEK